VLQAANIKDKTATRCGVMGPAPGDS
jgi:hypothetical protein